MAEALKEEEKTEKKDSSVKTLLIVGIVLTVIAVASGWFLGMWVSKEVTPSANNSKEPVAKASASLIMSDSRMIILPPILTNIAVPEKTWIRMEVALVVKPGENISPDMVADISNDFISFLHQMTIEQIKGPSGLMNLRTDLFDRAKIRSDNKISNILISSLVIEQ
ncbi:flagellar basal body-associated FliL family protein [Bartonella sp. WD16.2]|uniref:flagellar basal body-associated FliL family protein n=1 Tax=Bartonella sp. WD16.2 TaxID=1933904 RepID=UPI00099AD312|nr:flagellar basal body-associated FliL family protein [Bartonella sp. WD16.2]AQX20287.1 flagellar FliL protein [Bartonella sp. WD16.2]